MQLVPLRLERIIPDIKQRVEVEIYAVGLCTLNQVDP
jgi:hypothetical protein